MVRAYRLVRYRLGAGVFVSQLPLRGRCALGIDEHEPSGMLGLRAAHEAPHRRELRVGPLALARSDGTARDEREQAVAQRDRGPATPARAPSASAAPAGAASTVAGTGAPPSSGRSQCGEIGEGVRARQLARTDRRHVVRVDGPRGRGLLDPVDAEEVVGRRRLRGTRQQPVNRQHGPPLEIGGGQAQDVVALGDDPHAQAARAATGDPHAAPAERQPHPLAALARDGRMKRRVQQGGMDREAPRLAGLLLAERDLGVQLRAQPPRRPHVRERRPIGEAAVDEPLVHRVDVDRLRARRRPRAERLVRGGRARRQDSGRVAQPVARVRAREELDRAPPGPVGLADDRLQPHPRLPAQDERELERQLLDGVARSPRARVQRHLEQRGAGDQRVAEDLVVGEPRGLGGRDPTAQKPRVLPGERDRGAEQGVPRGVEAGRGHARRRRRRRRRAARCPARSACARTGSWAGRRAAAGSPRT